MAVKRISELVFKPERLGQVPHIPAHEAERRRALRLYRTSDLRGVRHSLRTGCYSEIVESVRLIPIRERRHELVRLFFATYPACGELSAAVIRYVEASRNPAKVRFIPESDYVDWRRIATGPREHEWALQLHGTHAAACGLASGGVHGDQRRLARSRQDTGQGRVLVSMACSKGES